MAIIKHRFISYVSGLYDKKNIFNQYLKFFNNGTIGIVIDIVYGHNRDE